ncbi:phosphate propanoyltransferase [Patescibacteria group bacterium]|nr:phosphate propanoyltransferase [Patescibacteria group bacterium]
MTKVPVEITARHIHLSTKDIKKLFGADYHLKFLKKISQPSDFACKETLKVIGPRASLNKVRVVGPPRSKTQIEITATEARILGIKAPYSVSSHWKKAGSASLVGPKGKIKLKNAVIIPLRHLHLNTKEATKLKLKEGDKVSVAVGTIRRVTFHQITVRVGDKYRMAVHLDTDEANAAGLKTCTLGQLIIKK